MSLNRMDEIRGAARRLFATRDGEIVLAYLRERFYDCNIKDEGMARQVGRRDVIVELNRLGGSDERKV